MFKKILIILFLFFSLTYIANAKDLKFAQIADVHFSLSQELNSKQSLKWAVDELNKIEDLDFVVFLGDNIDKSNKEILKSFLNIVSGLNKPYYIVLGNRDAHKISGITKDEYMEIVLNDNKNQKIYSSNYMFIPKNPDYKDLWFVTGIKKIKRNFIYVSFFNDEYALKEYDVINIAYAITPEYGIQSDDDLLKYCDFIAESLITEE